MHCVVVNPGVISRVKESIDAHELFDKHCPEYWAAFAAYNELLAQHVAGEPLDDKLKTYVFSALDMQEKAGRSVLNDHQIHRLRMQLISGTIHADMILPCKKIITYNHHATIDQLLKQYNETGHVINLAADQDGDDLLTAYSEVAGGLGGMAAAEGLSYEGCHVGNEVHDLAAVAELALSQGISLEQALRKLGESSSG